MASRSRHGVSSGTRGSCELRSGEKQVSQEDARAQFLIPVGSLGRNRAEASLERAQNLNPMADIKADPESMESKPKEFFTQFDARVVFCQLKEALAVDWSGEKAKAALKHTTLDYFLLQVLLKFRMDNGWDPSPQNYAEDLKLLFQICHDVLESLGVGADLLPDEFVSYCFSEMAPVSAMVGGVLGQEVVKVVAVPPHLMEPQMLWTLICCSPKSCRPPNPMDPKTMQPQTPHGP
uniref:Uncharacterized protein n=1 Tax=Buteo japonicus TaxID=224669 RepID=A0A8B9ZDU1_9AVES